MSGLDELGRLGDCPICSDSLWLWDWGKSCPKCNLEFPDTLEARIEKAKEDEWGLYAFYGRLDELKGRRVKPARDAKHLNFTEDEHVIVSEVHPPNSVRISYRDGFSVGLRGLSDLNLSSLPNINIASNMKDSARIEWLNAHKKVLTECRLDGSSRRVLVIRDMEITDEQVDSHIRDLIDGSMTHYDNPP
jgi:hypothetical protein